MLLLTREMLVLRLLELPALASASASQEPWFNERFMLWLQSVESSLLRLRHPMAGHIAVQRSEFAAALAGHHDAAVRGGRSSRRHTSRAAALSAMGEVETVLQRIVADTDAQLAAHREKVVQLLAVASASSPVELPIGLSREAWLTEIWSGLGIREDARGMYNYLQATVSRSDLHAILGELVDNLLGVSEGDVFDNRSPGLEPS